MPKRLDDLDVHEVSGVDAAANFRRFLVAKAKAAPMKTEAGASFPAEAYAYVPYPAEPSTWKLRLWETPALKVTASQVGRAVAALGKGFRGQKVSIPAADLAGVKRKVLAAWRKVNGPKAEVPSILKGATMSKPNAALRALAKALPKTVRKGLGDDLKAMLCLDDDGEPMATTEAPELMDFVEDQQDDAAIVSACEALCSAIDALQDSDELADKKQAFQDILDEFAGLVLGSGVLKSVGVIKAGRKISSSNMAIITQIQHLLGQLMAAAGGPPAEGEEEEPGEDGASDDDQQNPQDGVEVEAARTGAPGVPAKPDSDEMEMAYKARKARRKARLDKAGQKEATVAKSAEFIALEKRTANAESLAKAERDLRLKGEALAKVRTFGAVPGWTPTEMADALLKADGPMAAKLEAGWKAAGEVVRKSALFSAIGESGSNGGTMDPGAMLIAKARDLVKSGATKSMVTAMQMAGKEHPDLAQEHIAAQRARH